MASNVLRNLRARGFDESRLASKPGERGVYRPKCSRCEVLVIQGLACHETGCPNAIHECAGCNELIPVRQKYCEVCQ